MNPKQIAKEILDWYRQKGDHEYGERVTMNQHMVQAARLAEAEGYDEETILAAFLHDIGHFFDDEHEQMDVYGTEDHDKLGADYLRERGFSEKIAVLVEGHVAAKRYLTYARPEYYEQLSDASKATLAYQGGPMSEEEALVFKASPYFEACIKMRYWDDEGKMQEKVKKEVLDEFEERIERYLQKRA